MPEFPEPHDLRDQVNRGYTRTDQEFDFSDFGSYEFYTFMYFLNWKKGMLGQELRRPFLEHCLTLVRGYIQYLKRTARK
jgi:hypothetical protein